MAIEMKQLLALLLLACVCAVHGERGPKRRKDICTQGMVAIEVFFRYQGCRAPRPRDMVRELMDNMQNNFTVASLNYTFTNYCSAVMPRAVECFDYKVRNCSARQQRSLMWVARETGFFCQPFFRRVNSGITHLLTQLSDDDLVDNPDCVLDEDNWRDIHEMCVNRSMEAIGMAHRNWSRLYDLTMEQMVPKVQTFVRTMVTCTVSQIRDMPDRCPQWRGLALKSIHFVFFPLMGNSVTFTNEEIDRLFGWGSTTGQVSENVFFQ